MAAKHVHVFLNKGKKVVVGDRKGKDSIEYPLKSTEEAKRIDEAMRAVERKAGSGVHCATNGTTFSCYKRSQPVGWTGHGNTPEEAYENWKRNVEKYSKAKDADPQIENAVRAVSSAIRDAKAKCQALKQVLKDRDDKSQVDSAISFLDDAFGKITQEVLSAKGA